MANKRIKDMTEETAPDIDAAYVEVDSTAGGSKKVLLRNATRVSGFHDYNDLATGTTPITIPATTWTKLTNDKAGPNTNTLYPPFGITSMWNTGTNQFDFTELALGDQVEIRFDISITTTAANQTINGRMQFGIGVSAYEIDFIHGSYKTAGTYPVGRYVGFYMGNALTMDNPAEIQIYSDSAATARVNGFYINITRR